MGRLFMTVSPLVYCSAHFFAVGMAARGWRAGAEKLMGKRRRGEYRVTVTAYPAALLGESGALHNTNQRWGGPVERRSALTIFFDRLRRDICTGQSSA